MAEEKRLYNVNPDDPFKEQLYRGASDDLWQHIATANEVLRQAQDQDAPISSSLVALTQHFIDDEEGMPRERLASMLALALLRIAQGS